MGKILKIGEAAEYLNVSIDTLRKWDKSNKLKPLETAGGHRRYDTDTLDEFLGKKKKDLEEFTDITGDLRKQIGEEAFS